MNIENNYSIKKEVIFTIPFSIIFFYIFDFLSVIFLNLLVFLPYFVKQINFLTFNSINSKIHGIQNYNTLRFGGSVIILFIFLNIFFYNQNYFFLEQNKIIFYLVTLFSIVFLGFIDDILGGVHYLLKFNILFFSILFLLLINNDFLFNQTYFIIVNDILSYKSISIILTVIIISGFVNAANISDGANGILSGISSIVFLVLYKETNDPTFLVILKYLIIFFIYNILISRIILGDTGSYFLGFLISTICIYYYNNLTLSAALLGSILIYPCLEIVFSIVRRLIQGNNPLKPDNKHLHNLIFYYLKIKLANNYINSFTGLLIIVIFSLPAYLLYELLNTSFSIYFWLIFLLQVLAYFILYVFFSLTIKNLKSNE